MIRVVAGAVFDGRGRLLAAQKARGPRAGQWELPGGKVEDGESDADALRRELQEELGVDVAVHAFLTSVQHRYEDVHIELVVHRCTIVDGATPRAIEHAALQWVDLAGVEAALAWAAADHEVVLAVERVMRPGAAP